MRTKLTLREVRALGDEPAACLVQRKKYHLMEI